MTDIHEIRKTRIYESESQMKHDIKNWEKAGWVVVETTVIDQGWGMWKTCCLGCLFLPLALLGKKQGHFQVVYQYVGKPGE